MAGNTYTWFGGSGSADSSSNWTPSDGGPNAGDTAIVHSGTAILPNDAQLNSNTLAVASATISFTGDQSLNFSIPTTDENSLITNVVAGVSGAETTVLDSGGIFINQGSIQADAAAGSSFTINVTADGTVPGYFINYNPIEVDAGNSMTIAVGASSEFFNAGEIQVNGGSLFIDGTSGIAGGYAPIGGAVVIDGGGTVETTAAYASNVSGAAPYYAFADSTAGNTLKIDNYHSFGGNIVGFGAGDTIDLGTLIAGASQTVFNSSSGILNVENAGGTILASLLLGGGNFSGNVSVGTGADGDTVLTSTVQNDVYNNVDGTWRDNGVWSNGTPGSLDTAFIGLNAASPFTLTTGTTAVQVGALNLVDNDALLQITSNTTTGPSPINIFGGTLEVTGGNTLTATALRTSGGTIEVDANAVLDLTGHVVTSGVGAVNGTLAVANGNTSALRVYGGSLLDNGGTLVAGPGQPGGNGGAIQIGYDGSGTPGLVTVQNSGTSAAVVTDTYAIVSSDPTSFGILTLNGNVTWTDEIDPSDSTKRGYMQVGYDNEAGNSGTVTPPAFTNTATLLVENGATLVEQNAATIAATSDSSGSATIETGGLWNIAATGSFTTGSLGVGAAADGSLSVFGSGGAGGTVEVGTGGISVGISSNSNGTITVSGSGALLTTTGGVVVGTNGTGLLEALNGGTIELIGTKGITVGNSAGPGGTLVVGGTDTVDGASALLSVGSTGKGITVGGVSNGTVEVTSGGTIDLFGTGGIGVGTIAGVTGLISVFGPDALISTGTASSGMSVGLLGSGTVDIESAGTIQLNGTGGIGVGVSSTVATGLIIVNGNNALLSVGTGGGISVGQIGSGTLDVSGGGAVTIAAHGLGIGASATGVGTVIVSGSGSSITTLGTSGGINVGSPGTGVLTINGGTVNASNGVVIAGGGSTTSNGTVTVEGDGTLNAAGQFTVGQSGTGSLIIDGGGSVSSTGTFHGFNIGNGLSAGSKGFVSITDGTLVDNTGTNSGSFQVGQTNDASGTLQIGVGGTLITTGAFASIDSNDGGSAVATVSGGTWTSGQLTVGVTGTGSLDVNSSGLVNAGTNFITLGQNAGSDGIVTVETGGTLTTSGGLTVGSGGGGLLTVSGGGLVSDTGNNSVSIGFNANSSGTIDVNGGALTTSGGGIQVGQFGTGALNVSGGGAVTIATNGLSIGFGNSGVGTVTVSGSDSSITTLGTSGGISVGSPGTGVLTINGGTVSASNGVVIAAGGTSTSNGMVTVEGGGTLNAAGQFAVGQNGTGTLIIDGGTVSSTGTFHGFDIGDFSGSNGFVSITAGTLVDNTGTNSGSFQVGQTNDASGTLQIGLGGTLITTGASASIDSNDGGSAVATVSGGTWTTGQLNVGVSGTGSLDVNSSGLVNAGTNFISLGQNAGSDGIVTVESGGTLTTSGGLTVGSSGAGLLTVSGGGLVSNTGSNSIGLGFNTNSSGTIDINGGTLTDTAGGGFSVGGTNASGAVTVQGGGLLKTGGSLAFADINATGSGTASAVVSGGTWTSAGSIIVGDTGTGSLDINSNGVVNAGSRSILIGNQSGADGTLSLESGGMLQAGFVALDNNNNGAVGSLVVAGGTATLASLQENGTSTITVSSGSLSVSGSAIIGQSGTGAALNITGGNATTGTLTLGSGIGASGTASVSNASLTINGQLDIGTQGTGIATVNSGGSISADGLTVGQGAGNAGPGTLIINGGNVGEIGNVQIGSGGDAFVTVEAGGTFTATNVSGFNYNIGSSNGGTAAVVVNDGLFSTSGKPLFIGNGGNASVLVENGGSFITTFSGGGPGIDINATGTAQASVTVTANSSWTLNDTNGQLVVGDTGNGALTIGTGGLVDASGNTVDIANQSGGQATVTVNGGTLVANSLVIAGNSGSSGTLDVGSGGLVQAGSVTAGVGAIVSLAGGTVDPTTAIQVNAGGAISGFGTLAASITNDSTIASSGGTLEITGSVTGFGTLALDTGSTLLLDSQPGSNPYVAFNSGSPETLIIGAPIIAATTTGSNFGGVLSVASGDRIELGSSIVINSVSLIANGPSMNADIAVTQGGTSGFYVLNDVTFSGVADSFTIGTDGTTGDDYIQAVQAPCFIAGTRITTERGELSVEELAVGDRIQVVGTSPSTQPPSASGGTGQPIVWLGHRTVDCARHPQPSKVWPVRVSAGAFGPGRPYRDLWLSPDHALLVGDVLIPVKYLINGTTIAQMQVDEVTYYHVKLPRHAVILAEGLPAESYLDTGDRSNFANGEGPIALYPDFSSRIWDAEGCAPLVVTGPQLDAARHWVNGLAGRAIRAA